MIERGPLGLNRCFHADVPASSYLCWLLPSREADVGGEVTVS
jgi:hypothetical protein